MTLIKNNLKLMLRCKPIVLIVIMWVMVTGMLSAVFSDLMTDDLDFGDFTVGYSMAEGSIYAPVKPILEQVCAENGIELMELTDGSAQKAIDSGRADVFAEFTDDGCTVYSDGEHDIEAGVTEMLVSSILSSISIHSGVQVGDYVTEYKMDVQPMPDSQMYYTVAYTVYFIWCSMIVLCIVTSSEHKNKIGARFRTTPVSSLQIYLSRFVTTALMITALAAVGIVICTLLYHIEWAEIPTISAILLLGCIAAAAFATVLFSLISNSILAVVVGYCVLMFWGFFGGTFCPYMWAPWADGLRDVSPIYYMTRSIVELNMSGSSDFTRPAVMILCGLSVVCIPLGMAAVKFQAIEK